jgi:2-C-methyl-D-erythritol 4-phosphate cytidylyltransferase
MTETRTPEDGGRDDEPTLVVLPDDGSVDPTLAASLLARLREDPHVDAVAPLEPVVDAVKLVDASGLVIEAIDRSELALLGAPIAVRNTALDPRSGAPEPRSVRPV